MTVNRDARLFIEYYIQQATRKNDDSKITNICYIVCNINMTSIKFINFPL